MKNSIKPKIWGPHGWKFLHYVSLGYPEKPTDKEKIYYKNFYYSLQNVLPCEKCAQNYKKNIIEYPIDNHLQNRDSLVKWVIDIHNKVAEESYQDQEINIVLHYYLCTLIDTNIILSEHEAIEWVKKQDFSKYEFVPGDGDITSLI